MNVLITGVSRGIGKAMVIECLERGFNCIGLTRNKKQVSEYILNHPNSKVVEIDWSKYDSYKDLVSSDIFRVDVLINNAATILVKPAQDTNAQDLKSILDVNVIAPFQLTRALYAKGCLAEGAHIVNISSMGGFQGAAKFPGLSAYSISKAGLVAMTESLAIEYPELSINCLCLGAVQTEMLKRAFPTYKAEINDVQMAKYIIDFSLTSANLMTGCIIPVNKSNPV
ncbi:MAG: SDR family oxidoreductase [Salibacteraceae bacterium]